MQAIIAMLVSAAATKSGQAVISWLFSKLWKYADKEVKDLISENQLKSHIKATLADYEKVIAEAQEKAKDGLTEEEIAEIEKKKIELEERLFNEKRK